MNKEYSKIFFDQLEKFDEDIFLLSKVEEERQLQKVVLIPSESITPHPVREALSTAFVSISSDKNDKGGGEEGHGLLLSDGKIPQVCRQEIL